MSQVLKNDESSIIARTRVELFLDGTNGYCLSAIVCSEFLHNVFDMHFDSFFRNEEPIADILVSVSVRQMSQYFDFSRGKRFLTHMLSEVSRDFRRNTFFPRARLTDDLNQILCRFV